MNGSKQFVWLIVLMEFRNVTATERFVVAEWSIGWRGLRINGTDNPLWRSL